MASNTQIFISYRRDGGDVTAKLICEALKNKGYSVVFDFDALKGGFFDTRILQTIQGCSDVVLVLPVGGLDRCVNNDDWVRQEIRHAISCKKNIIPVMLNGFEFPDNLPEDIEVIRRYNGVRFAMDYFDAVIDKIAERLIARPQNQNYQNGGAQNTYNGNQSYTQQNYSNQSTQSQGGGAPFIGRLTIKRPLQWNGIVRNIKIKIDGVDAGVIAAECEAHFSLAEGFHKVDFAIDWLKAGVTVSISPRHPESEVVVSFSGIMMNKLKADIVK